MNITDFFNDEQHSNFTSTESSSTFSKRMFECIAEFNSTISSSDDVQSTNNQTIISNCLKSILILSSGEYYHNLYPINLPTMHHSNITDSINSTISTSLDFLPLTTIRDVVRFWVQRILVPLITVIGLFGNLLTMVVMCQRRMSTSSTHIYLAALALFDALYLTFTLLLSLAHYPSVKSNISQTKLLYWHSYPSMIFGCDFASNTSIWLTVCFTIERYIVIRYPIKGKVLCTTSRAVRVIVLVGLICFLITFPTFFEWKTVASVANSTVVGQTSDILVSVVNTSLGLDQTYKTVYYWITVFCFVFVPLSILTIFNLFLIRSVRKSSQKRQKWIADQQRTHLNSHNQQKQKQSFQMVPVVSGSCVVHPTTPTREHPFAASPPTSPKSQSLIARFNFSTRFKQFSTKIKQNMTSTPSSPLPRITPTPTCRILLRQDAHITRLLIAVVLFFLICQLPTALVIIYNATLGQTIDSKAEETILQTLGNVCNLLVAINSAGNFALYCLLSRKYRRTLLDLVNKLKQLRH